MCRLYHIRGGITAKQKAKQKIRGLVRAKLFKYRLVPRRREALALVKEDHAQHHDGHNVAEPRLSEQFLIRDLRAKVSAVGANNCCICAAYEPVPKKPVVPILTSRKGELVMFDLTQFYCPVGPTHACVRALHATSYTITLCMRREHHLRMKHGHQKHTTMHI